MTKLEELTALLVNELNDFNNNIEKLENISKQLNGLKIKIDVSEYKAIIEAHQKQMDATRSMIESFEKSFNNKINQAKIYPTWAVVVFIFSLILLVTILIYSIMS